MSDLDTEKILKREKFDTYELVTEQKGWKDKDGKPGVMVSAYNLTGYYIGDEKDAKMYAEKGIVPEIAQDGDNVCSIGFCEKEDKWYGWSHRAMYGFGIGDETGEGKAGQQYLPPKFKAKTLDDARKMAIAFARSVG